MARAISLAGVGLGGPRRVGPSQVTVLAGSAPKRGGRFFAK